MAVWLETGKVVVSQTGRSLSILPRIDCTTNRKTQNTLKRVHKWLVDEAIAEAESRKDGFNLFQWQNINPAKLTQSDVDCLNLYLFGVEDGS